LAHPTLAETAPQWVTPLVGGNGTAGGEFTLRASVTGENLFYEWFRGETLLPDAAESTLRLHPLRVADAGDYRVIVRNGAGRIQSEPVTLRVEEGNGTDGEGLNYAAWQRQFTFPPGLAGEDADADGDGSKNMLEFVLGSHPILSTSVARPVAAVQVVGSDSYPVVTLRRNRRAMGVTIRTIFAHALDFAQNLGATEVSVEDLGDGTERVTLRSEVSLASGHAQFIRTEVVKH
jgi:hypothetical protein